MLKRILIMVLLTVAQVAAAENLAPTVTITSPANNAAFIGPATVTLNAGAADTDGTVAKVEFYNGSTLLGTDTTAPYSYTWSGVPTGTHALTAKATDNAGAVTTSAVVNIIIHNAPLVSIASPANNTVFPAPANISLTANASDTDGSIAKVDYYYGATLLGSSTVAPYAVTWSNVAAGLYGITAKATDNNGATKTSTVVNVTVNAPPTVSLVSPVNGKTYAAPATIPLSANASDANGIGQVAFRFNTDNFIGNATTSPYALQWSNVPAGTYSVTATATDKLGATNASNASVVTVVNNAAPVVNLSAGLPSGIAPASVALTATATDTDGSIAKVEFFDGSTLIAMRSAAPYSVAWNNVAAGTHTVTAKATDNLGTVTVSAPVTVQVAAPPARLYFVHSDHLNTPRLIVDEGNNTVWQWQNNDPFGGNLSVAAAGFEFNLRFAGQYFDKETNLHYNTFRDYDPSTGRYIESDPIGLAGGINTYAYVGGNPLRYIDPLGLDITTANSNRAAGITGGSLAERIYQDIRNIDKAGQDLIRDLSKPITDTKYCGSSAECAAGLPPSKPEFRSTEEIEEAQCEMICGWLGPGNVIPGGISLKQIAGWVGANAATNIGCKQFCKKKNVCEK